MFFLSVWKPDETRTLVFEIVHNNVFQDTQYNEYLPELRRHLEGRAATPDLFASEESMCIEFDRKKNWREG